MVKSMLQSYLPGIRALFALVLYLACADAGAQTNPDFNVNLIIDYSAIDQTIALFNDQPVNTKALADLRGNRIAASTAGLIADRRSVSILLASYLDSLKYHDIISDDIFHLEDARKNVARIQEILDRMKKENFNRRVVATVEQIFPPNARISLSIPVYVVALGHENVDAFVRRIVWHGDIPEFVGEGQGELTIVVNLSKTVEYGRELEERFVALLGVVAHETFHAAFGAYKQNAASWKEFYARHGTPFDALLDICQNEGIAYYLSLDQEGRGYLPRDWYQRTQEVFQTFNANASELLSNRLSPSRAQSLLRSANLSGYWGSYGAMAGMFMAREIDRRLGREALIETISKDPFDFCQKYIHLTEADSNLPKLAGSISSVVLENR